MPDFLLGDKTQLYIAALTYPSRSEPASGNFKKLAGGTNAQIQIGENDITTKEFDSALWEDGVIGALNWQIPWDGNWRASDPGYAIVETAALSGAEVFIDLRPLGTGTGLKRWKGVASITGWTQQLPADGIITNSFTLKGRGALTPGTQS